MVDTELEACTYVCNVTFKTVITLGCSGSKGYKNVCFCVLISGKTHYKRRQKLHTHVIENNNVACLQPVSLLLSESMPVSVASLVCM